MRHYDQEERQSDAAVAETAESVCKQRSTRFLRKTLASTHPGRKQQDEVRVLRGFFKLFPYFRALEGHSGGMTIALELMEHILVPHDWKRVCVSQEVVLSASNPSWRTDSFHCRSTTKQGRTTDQLSSHPLNPIGENPDEEAPSDDFTTP